MPLPGLVGGFDVWAKWVSPSSQTEWENTDGLNRISGGEELVGQLAGFSTGNPETQCLAHKLRLKSVQMV